VTQHVVSLGVSSLTLCLVSMSEALMVGNEVGNEALMGSHGW